MNIEKETVDLLISHKQIHIRSIEFDESLCQWGEGNIKQGAIIYNNYLIFDPLPEEEFGANVNLINATSFSVDTNAQRCISVPFIVVDTNLLQLASASEKFQININLVEGKYQLYYEICEEQEVYYNFTFVKSEEQQEAKYLLSDPWGGDKDKLLIEGYVN